MLVSAAWIGPAILGGVDVVMQNRLYGGGPIPMRAVLFASGDWMLYAFLTPAVFAASRRWPLARPHLVRRSIVHLAISLVFCAAWAGAGTVLRATLMPASLEGGITRNFLSWLFITLPFGVAVYLAVVGIEHGIRYFAEARERELQVARLSEQLSGARFAALRAQLNPHFLFNTLNTIAVLVRDGDRSGAVSIVEQLSDVLRRTLSRHRANEVTLDEELDLVRQYLSIEQARFSDRLRPEFQIEDGVRSGAVPGFAVQHLVENAIRHGIARRSEVGHVSVTARREGDVLVIVVADDGPGIDPQAAMPPAHGIENTRERLRGLYGDRASLVVEPGASGGTIAWLRVPYRDLPREPAAEFDDDAR
jgi:two-component system LytT family sensor kinase